MQLDAFCVTVNVLPPIVSVPVLELVEPLAATLKVTVPFPDPDAPAVTVIQVALLVAVQAQLAVTVTDPVPPLAGTDCDVGLIVTQVVPDCVTGITVPATVMDPVLLLPLFALTKYVTTPEPVRPEVMAIHPALLDVVHAQLADVVTVMDPLPPDAGMIRAVGLTV